MGKGLYDTAKALVEKNLALPEYQVAGMDPDQTKALRLGREGIGSYQGFLYPAGMALSAGQQMVGTGAGQYGNAFDYSNQAAQGTINAATPIGQDQIQQYMNPYSNLVMRDQMAEMQRAAGLQQQQLNKQAVNAGAFGGSRQGIMQTEQNRNLMQTQNQAINQSMAQNYAQAINTAQQQQGVQMGAYNQLANIGAGIGALGTNYGQLGTAMGNLGVQQAALGQQQQQQSQSDVNFLYNLGQQEQQQGQRLLDANRANQLQTDTQAYKDLQFLSDIYKGVPSSQMTISKELQAAPSPFQQVVGVGTGVAATAKAINGIL
jgi:hypothetical protein